ncbi:MAG: hypothetical protein U0L23_08170 [Lachnospiraceae bacterium]|nr:hypothetical protein [Lachnospiraceae bacterium]
MKKVRIILSIMVVVLMITAVSFFIWKQIQIKNGKEKLETFSDSQIVFAYRYRNNAWGKVDDLLIVNKNNQCKKINLLEKECPKNVDSELLNYFDAFMADETYKYSKEDANFSEKELSDMINLSKHSLKKAKPHGSDAGEHIFYCVKGEKNNRSIQVMKVWGNSVWMPKTNKKQINKICDKLQEIYEKAD